MKLYILTTTVLLALIISCGSQTTDNIIEGFQIPLPEKWMDKSELSVKDNLSKFNLKESEILALMRSHNNSIPVAIYMKYDPSEYNGPIPTIQVNLRPNNSQDLTDFKTVMQNSITQMEGYFSNFEILTPMEETIVDGIKGIMFVSQFEMLNKTGENWTIRSWTYAFPSGKHFYQINFSDTENENSEEIYQSVISQIKFRK
jgi:hypothetical protein